nr:hypothetical protein BaRGS_010951 [Batillaria attramentaria]
MNGATYGKDKFFAPSGGGCWYQTHVISRDGLLRELDGIVIKPTYDAVNNFAMLEIPHCDTRIKFRAFDPTRPKHQRQLPGVTIQAPQHADVSQMKSWWNRAEELGLVDDDTAIIYDILTEKPEQE